MMTIASSLGNGLSISEIPSLEAAGSTLSNTFLQQRSIHQPEKMLHAMKKHGCVRIRSASLAVSFALSANGRRTHVFYIYCQYVRFGWNYEPRGDLHNMHDFIGEIGRSILCWLCVQAWSDRQKGVLKERTDAFAFANRPYSRIRAASQWRAL